MATYEMSSPGGRERNEESYLFDDSSFEPNPSQLGDDWDTMMEEYMDEYEEFNDVGFPKLDDKL